MKRNYTIQLSDQKINNIITRFHLFHQAKLVKQLNNELEKKIIITAYYDMINKYILRIDKKNEEYDIGCIITLGSSVDRVLDKYSDKYLETHILDVLTNVYIEETQQLLLEELRHDKRNLSKINFPGTHIDMEYNKILLEIIKEAQEVISVNEAYVMTPLKTVSFLAQSEELYNEEHNCNRCNLQSCMYKKEYVTLTVYSDDEKNNYKVLKGSNLTKVLTDKNYNINQYCSGNKTCGKCKVKVISNSNISQIDKLYLTNDEIENRISLACGIELNQDRIIEIINNNTMKNSIQDYSNYDSDNYIIAIDVGTTTLELSLVDKVNNKVISTIKEENAQIKYGLDVLSRSKWSIENNGIKTLQKTIISQIEKLSNMLLENKNIDYKKITQITISANTIMSYFILGLEVNQLVVAPFELDSKEEKIINASELGFESFDCQVLILPLISAFVGSDIVSGILYTKTNRKDKQNILLIDLGTNGEIVLKVKDKYYCCSTAVGPAFEGTHITGGMIAKEGAISSFSSFDDYQVIGNIEPIGICGSGLIDIMDYLLKAEEMDLTGLLRNTEEKKIEIAEKIYITQADIRHIQMAKSAIMTGVNILLDQGNIKKDQIDNVYLTGGFGEFINVNHAIKIGLIPSIDVNKIKTLHNTSLKGTIEVGINNNIIKEYKEIVDKVKYIDLASHKDFYKIYIDNINF